MNSETLNRLLVDRALDEVPPDVRELLDDYLGANPAAAARAEQLSATARLAAAAVAPSRTAVAGTAGWKRPAGRLWLAAHGEALRLAACLALGIGVGWLAQPPGPPAAVVSPVQNVAGRAGVGTPAPGPAGTGAAPFWSISNLVRTDLPRRAGGPVGPAHPLHWNSPAQKPFWEE